MRIAVYHNLPSGGAKRALQEQIKRLSDRHRFEVYTLSGANSEFANLQPFVKVHRIYEFRPLPLLNTPLGRLNQIVRLLDLKRLNNLEKQIGAAVSSESYDLVYVNPCQYQNAPGLIRTIRSTPAIFYCQEPLRVIYESTPGRPYDSDSTTRRRFLNRIDPLPGIYKHSLRRNDYINMHAANRVLVNSRFIQGSMRKIYGLETIVNYLGVDTSRFDHLNLERGNYILSVGALTPLKGFDFLILALAEIPLSRRPQLVIASNSQNPPEKIFLEKLAFEKNVDLKLVGNVSDQRLVELYNQAFLTIYAPVREPFGFVSLEAMACETPIVAVREGGVQETVLHEETGLLVNRDPIQFADAICSLIGDPALAKRMGKAGRSHVLKHWTWDQSVENLEHQFSSVSGFN